MKNRKALILLLSANAVSHFAQGISMLAIPWYFAKHLDASSTFASIYSIATFVTLFWGLYAGTLIDRFPRKNIFIGLCAISAIVLLSISSIGFINGAIPMFGVAFVFCFTLFNFNIHYPTLYAFGQEITEKENYSKTNSLLEVMGQSTNVFSGAIAILLIEGIDIELFGYLIQIQPWQIHEIFLMDGITYLIAMSLIYFINYVPSVKNQVSKEPVLLRLKEGVNYLKKRPLLFYFGNASFTVFIFVLISTHLLWPIYVEKHLGELGNVFAITKMNYAAGALFSGFFISIIFRKSNIVFSIIILMILALISIFILSISQSVPVLFGLAIGLGIANAGIRIQRITYLFNHIPNHIIGRVNSVFQSINILLRSIFIGIFSLSFFSEGSNITWALVLGGIVISISTFPLLWNYKELRDLDRKN
ncbi:MAG: MFS transporter [Flavobacteriales bacterium]|nr:MFS transporter [Flavobacteriales bacterium]